MNNQKPTALLLGSGGAKGAFQIGAWQALEEAGMLTDIRAVAGCSVGALNAVLFALGDLALAKRVWMELQPDDLLARGADGAVFSREGLSRIIDTLPLHAISQSRLELYVSAHHEEANQAAFFRLNGLPAENIRTLLLASSAIPHIYPPERYLNNTYSDGSATPEGALCIEPVYKSGHRNLLMITMNAGMSVYGGRSTRTGSLTEQYPDCEFTIIKPLRPMGNLLTGTLNFNHGKLQSRMEQGYSDARTTLEGLQYAPQTKEEVNAVLVEKMSRMFTNGTFLADFIRLYGKSFAPNVPMPTLGGNVWYDNIFEVDGWRLQQHRTAGLRTHYRILDPAGVRAAWVLDPSALLDALAKYEKQMGW